MKHIEINPQYLKKLAKKPGHSLSRADIFFDSNKVYKIYFTTSDFKQIKEKIEFFHNLNLEDTLNPLEIIEINNREQGFSMNNFQGKDFRILKKFSLSKKIQILDMAKIALQRIHKKGVTVGDIYSKNILIAEDGSCVKFCDIDSFVMNDEQTLINYRGSLYRNHFGIVDQRCDIFLFNIVTLAILFNESEFDIIGLIKSSLIHSDEPVINGILRFISLFEENEHATKFLLDYLPEDKGEFVKELCL